MFSFEMTTLPDAEIQLLYKQTGRLGTIDVFTLVNQTAVLASDMAMNTGSLPIEAGAGIEFSIDPTTGDTVISVDPNASFAGIQADTLDLAGTIPPAGGEVGQILYASPSSGDSLAGRFAGDNGTETSQSGNPYVLLDFNPQDLIAGTGIAIDRTDTTATISVTGGGVVEEVAFAGAAGATTLTPDPVTGNIIQTTPDGVSSALLTSADVLDGVAGLAPGSTFTQQTYVIDINATVLGGYSAINDPSAGTGVILASPAITVTPPVLIGPVVVTLALDTPFDIGYNVTLTPIRSPSLLNTYQNPTLSLNPDGSSLTAVSFNIEQVILPTTLPVIGVTINNPTVPGPLVLLDYSFAIQVVVTGA